MKSFYRFPWEYKKGFLKLQDYQIRTIEKYKNNPTLYRLHEWLYMNENRLAYRKNGTNIKLPESAFIVVWLIRIIKENEKLWNELERIPKSLKTTDYIKKQENNIDRLIYRLAEYISRGYPLKEFRGLDEFGL